MGKRVTNNDIRKLKKVGETWEAISFPEPWRFWQYEYPWPDDLFSKNNLGLLMINLKATKGSGQTNSHRYSKKNPYYIESGLEINDGMVYTTPQNKVARFRLRIDSVKELNAIMTELSKLEDMKTWQVLEIEIFNKKNGAVLFYQIHNPDGSGSELYLYDVDIEGKKRLYLHIPYGEQALYANEFYERFASCCLVNDVIPHCDVKRRAGLVPGA